MAPRLRTLHDVLRESQCFRCRLAGLPLPVELSHEYTRCRIVDLPEAHENARDPCDHEGARQPQNTLAGYELSVAQIALELGVAERTVKHDRMVAKVRLLDYFSS